MTLFQQFTDSVTGLNLNSHFRAVRIKLMLFIATLLCIVLFISAYSTFEANKTGLNIARQQTGITLPRPSFIDQFQDYEIRTHKRALDQIRTNIIVSHLLLLFLLSIGTWIGLYFLLLPLSQSHREQEQFLAEASHDLRTPLAIIYSELSLARTEKNVKSLQSTLQNALGEIKRLRYLSDSLLSQIAGEKTEWESVQIQTLVSEIWDKLQPANSKQITLNIKDLNKEMVITHKAHLYRIVYNILDNIIKYADEKSLAQVAINSGEITFYNMSQAHPEEERTGSLLIRRLSKLIQAHYFIQWEDGIYQSTLSFTKK